MKTYFVPCTELQMNQLIRAVETTLGYTVIGDGKSALRNAFENVLLVDQGDESGMSMVFTERKEQIEKHGRTVLRDVIENGDRELSVAASSLINPDLEDDYSSEAIAKIFPKKWNEEIVYKMFNRSYKGRVIIAAALLVAEIDRINAIEATFVNPVLSAENTEEWKAEFNLKMKLWHDLDKYIPDMAGDDWASDYAGQTVDEGISGEKEGWD